ncbi:uncharacterized protein SPAPADRAFT_62134 [Spathaspora passalidarum NRRL Y-27907]|uniref:Uncharacterized protein n=1 Tax=Spathaspora passalidarum (strain NRRL Y-27907 / 11-Y1) TaxID=619300 RepID=G3AQJ2_SPAPN|nr:uncharacterized protein SPAPADRAFT_62134 [Spathaspora passalidarum NRRL Y-27907]EGW31539.1 hypothetical protein SPAPADRAFT_62134 [Spathaspora passalidarum NRRL Y-27907]
MPSTTDNSYYHYTTSKHININDLDMEYDNEEIFELEDTDSISDASTISSINSIHQESPLLSSTYYQQYNSSEENVDLLYECCICKQKMSNDTLHDCLSTISGEKPDIVIQSNNELIQTNYRKWLFNITPNVPF